MDKLNEFMDCLDESDFEEAAKVEAEIIEEECKNSGICRNFLTCKVINNPNMKDMIEKERGKASLQLKWDTVNLDSIQIDHLPYPKSSAHKDIDYQNKEKIIIDKVNESIDEAFLSKLDEKCTPPFYFLEDKITPSALRAGIAKMRSHGYMPYSAIWNSGDFLESVSDPNWKEYNITPNEYAGWQQDLLGIRNFNSPVVPKGKVYIATFPKDLGNAIICKKLTFSQKPMDITFNCSIDIDLALNNKIGVVSIIKKQQQSFFSVSR